MLDRMYGNGDDGVHDHLMDFTTPVSGAFYFAPSLGALDGILPGSDDFEERPARSRRCLGLRLARGDPARSSPRPPSSWWAKSASAQSSIWVSSSPGAELVAHLVGEQP